MHKNTKILIVEDEMIIGAKISMLLTEMEYEVTGLIPRAEEVLHHLKDNTPDIVLLDINLKGKMDGIDLAGLIHRDYHIPVIFLTANADDATFERAKATKPYAFLTKPLKKMELKRALELTVNLVTESSPSLQKEEQVVVDSSLNDRIFVQYKNSKIKIMLATIVYVTAERNYCRIITQSDEYLLSMPMKSLETILPVELFQRIHRSHIINLQHLDEVDDTTVIVGGKMLALSKSYRKAFMQRLKSV